MKAIDMHCDTIMCLYDDEKHGKDIDIRRGNTNITLEKMKAGDYLCQCFAMFVYLKETDDPFKQVNEMIDVYYREIEKNSDLILPTFSASDIERNMNEGKMSSLLTIEEGAAAGLSMGCLRNLYRLGVRMITLTWNFENGIGFPNVHKLNDDGTRDVLTPSDKGLSEFGIEMIKEMERLGMIIDVSHLSDGGFYDVLRYTNKPFVASHSNARSVSPHVRNMSDDMILKLAERGGVMGINYASDFLELGSEMSTVDNMVKHIEYIRDLAGIDVIGLGSDFDGIRQNLEMKDCSMLNMLEERLYQHGFSKEEVEKIFYKNVLRVFKEVLG